MAHLAAVHDEEPIAGISAAAALSEADEGHPALLRHAQRRRRLLDLVAAARTRAERRLTALTAEATRAEAAERLKAWGDLIYAYLWQIAPGQNVLEVDGESIPLDPARSGKENAQAYFERYRKARDATRQIPELVAETRSELAYLEQLATLIAQAPGFAELEALAAEWTEQEAPRPAERSRRQRPPRRPSALLDAQGNAIYVGRSGPQNELVTFEMAGPDDTWLHARGVGGSHVVIRWRSPGAPQSEATIEAAAALAAWYSAARESRSVEVDVAPRRHVRKLKGGRPGMVTYRNERTVRVAPRSEDALRDVLTPH
jgi:predicted ribosome quality control (RQC) complex YloA/Tae2 family protein